MKGKKKSKKDKKEKKEKKNSNDDAKKGNVEQISRDDYYRKATEYREWLRKSKGIYFENVPWEHSFLSKSV